MHKHAKLKIDTVFFEQLVQEPETVKKICNDTIHQFDEALAYQHFDPSISIQNIGKPKDDLSIWGRMELSVFGGLLRRASKASYASGET